MSFDNALSQGPSLQHGGYPQVWDSSGLTQRQDLPGGGHAENREDSHVVIEGGNGQSVDLSQSHDLVDAPMPKDVDEVKDQRSVGNSENEDRHLLENQDSSNIRAAGGPPTWLSTAMLTQQNQALGGRENVQGHVEAAKWCAVCSAGGPQSCVCKSPMQASGTNATSFPNQTAYTHWLPTQGTGMQAISSQHRAGELESGKNIDVQFGNINHTQTRLATELNLSAALGRNAQPFLESLTHPPVAAPRYAGECSRPDWEIAREEAEREELRKRCLITNHPLYEEMLSLHAACLRVGTPVEQLPSIEAQLSRAPEVTEKYRVLRDQITDISQEEQAELDRFMAQYTFILGTFKEMLQHHVYTDVTEAMMSCWNLDQALIGLTGVRSEAGYGATMSDDEAEGYDSDYTIINSSEPIMDYNDSGGYGPLVPTDTERTLMERVRQELKHELKQGYKSKIEDVREEIMRKRRAGKLPEGTTTVLKAWWQAHSKWPYPTEEEKELLIQETGLELKQVNNWFINQRKRNWHGNPLNTSQSDSKSKQVARKSW